LKLFRYLERFTHKSTKCRSHIVVAIWNQLNKTSSEMFRPFELASTTKNSTAELSCKVFTTSQHHSVITVTTRLDKTRQNCFVELNRNGWCAQSCNSTQQNSFVELRRVIRSWRKTISRPTKIPRWRRAVYGARQKIILPKNQPGLKLTYMPY